MISQAHPGNGGSWLPPKHLGRWGGGPGQTQEALRKWQGVGWTRVRPPGMCTQRISGEFQAEVMESGTGSPERPRQGPAGELASLPRALDSLGRSWKQEPSGSAAFIFPQLVYGFTPGKFVVNGVVTLKHCSCVSTSSLSLTVLSEAGFRQDVFRRKVQ